MRSRTLLRNTVAWTRLLNNQGAKALFSTPAAEVGPSSRRDEDIPGLPNFKHISAKKRLDKIIPPPSFTHEYVLPEEIDGNGRKVLLITYGCQMNVNDMEVVRSLLLKSGYVETMKVDDAEVVLLMTCSIREGAEQKIWRELRRLKGMQRRSMIVGVLGCMAERVRHTLLEKDDLCQVVAGPDSYRDLPRLLAVSRHGQKALNIQLSLEETYADVSPVRMDPEGKSAFVSIMRGCDNMCTYCIVPFTRGRERSRPIDSILEEVRSLSHQGVKQVILLGQNVNSYRDSSESSISWGSNTCTAPGFSTVYNPKTGGRTFVTLLDHVSRVDPEMRIRFTSPHPKDFPLEVLQLIKERDNICNQIHLPAQSGDDGVLDAMGRGYNRETYLKLVQDIRHLIPDVSLTSDFIAGFCGESEEGHEKTLSLIREVGYSFCYVFPYSMREGTRAHRRLIDDVPHEIKKRRHQELANTFRQLSLSLNMSRIGERHLILVEGTSKRSHTAVTGRNDRGTTVIVEKEGQMIIPGDYIVVEITGASSQTMKGKFIGHSSIRELNSST